MKTQERVERWFVSQYTDPEISGFGLVLSDTVCPFQVVRVEREAEVGGAMSKAFRGCVLEVEAIARLQMAANGRMSQNNMKVVSFSCSNECVSSWTAVGGNRRISSDSSIVVVSTKCLAVCGLPG